RNIRKAWSFRYYSGVDHSHSYLHTKAPLQSPAMTRLPEVVVAPPAPPAPAECKEIRSAPTLFGLDAFGVGFKVRCEHHARFTVPDHIHEPGAVEGAVNHGQGSVGGNSHDLELAVGSGNC